MCSLTIECVLLLFVPILYYTEELCCWRFQNLCLATSAKCGMYLKVYSTGKVYFTIYFTTQSTIQRNYAADFSEFVPGNVCKVRCRVNGSLVCVCVCVCMCLSVCVCVCVCVCLCVCRRCQYTKENNEGALSTHTKTSTHSRPCAASCYHTACRRRRARRGHRLLLILPPSPCSLAWLGVGISISISFSFVLVLVSV